MKTSAIVRIVMWSVLAVFLTGVLCIGITKPDWLPGKFSVGNVISGLKSALEKELKRIEKQTGTRIRMVFPKDPILAFGNDPEYTKIAAEVGRRIFKDRFLLEGEEELFLSGDNAYRYFQHTRGLFCVFLAAVPQKRYPLHHPCFVIDEKVLPHSVEALYEIIRSM